MCCLAGEGGRARSALPTNDPCSLACYLEIVGQTGGDADIARVIEIGAKFVFVLREDMMEFAFGKERQLRNGKYFQTGTENQAEACLLEFLAIAQDNRIFTNAIVGHLPGIDSYTCSYVRIENVVF